MNEIKIFKNEELGLQIRAIQNEDGSISVNAEDTAIGFGWCRTEVKNGKEYISIRWATLNGFCKELGFANKLAKDDYIPESLYYLLGMKAGNERAQKYQRWLAIDVLPSLRRTGTYTMKQGSSKRTINALSSVNNAVRFLSSLYKDAAADPAYIAKAASRVYKDQTKIDFDVPLASEPEALYDKTAIAENLGMYSTNGNPHAQAVGALLSHLDIPESETIRTVYSHNGHEGVTVQYKPCVLDMAQKWLDEMGYPAEISGPNGNSCKVIYR